MLDLPIESPPWLLVNLLVPCSTWRDLSWFFANCSSLNEKSLIYSFYPAESSYSIDVVYYLG